MAALLLRLRVRVIERTDDDPDEDHFPTMIISRQDHVPSACFSAAEISMPSAAPGRPRRP